MTDIFPILSIRKLAFNLDPSLGRPSFVRKESAMCHKVVKDADMRAD